MEWVVFPALLIFIMLATIGAMNLIGNINEKLCSIHSKQKRLFSILFYGGSFLNAIFQFRIIIVPPKKKHIYLQLY